LPGVLAALAVVLGIAGCGVTIQTGPQTAEEATQSSEVQARTMRARWMNQLEAAQPVEKVTMLTVLIDSVSSLYTGYGYDVADQWRQGNEGRGENISDAEMREMVQRWTKTQQPLLQSYEDVIEFALEHIRKDNFFDETTDGLIMSLAEQFYEVYSRVFYPVGTLADYEYGLSRLQATTQELSDQVRADLLRYR